MSLRTQSPSAIFFFFFSTSLPPPRSTLFPYTTLFRSIASVSMLGAQGSGLGGNEATDQVGAREKADDHALAHHRKSVDVFRAHQVGHVRQGLVLRQAEHRAAHRFPDRNEAWVRGAALQLRARRCPKLPALRALHEIGDQVA